MEEGRKLSRMGIYILGNVCIMKGNLFTYGLMGVVKMKQVSERFVVLRGRGKCPAPEISESNFGYGRPGVYPKLVSLAAAPEP